MLFPTAHCVIGPHGSPSIRARQAPSAASNLACINAIAAYGLIVLGRASKFFVVVALVLTTGLHWAALQTVAWSFMLAGNLRSQPVTAAVTCTFDGLHPCCLCKAIAAGKKSDQKNEGKLPGVRLEYAPYASAVTIPAAPDREFRPAVNSIFTALTHPPLLPPPRLLPVSTG
jgi:hypothetical protein